MAEGTENRLLMGLRDLIKVAAHPAPPPPQQPPAAAPAPAPHSAGFSPLVSPTSSFTARRMLAGSVGGGSGGRGVSMPGYLPTPDTSSLLPLPLFPPAGCTPPEAATAAAAGGPEAATAAAAGGSMLFALRAPDFPYPTSAATATGSSAPSSVHTSGNCLAVAGPAGASPLAYSSMPLHMQVRTLLGGRVGGRLRGQVGGWGGGQ